MSETHTSHKSLTDWDRVDALRDEDIDLSDCPEITPEMFSRAVVRRNREPLPRRGRLTLDLDPDVLAWFKAQGEDYRQQIGEILKAYKDAHQGT